MLKIEDVTLFRVSTDAPELTVGNSLPEVSAALSLLDGCSYDQLAVSTTDGSAAFISGGRKGRYQLLIISGEVESVLLNAAPVVGEGPHSSGGQEVEVPFRQQVGLNELARALYYFLYCGELEGELEWEHSRVDEVLFPGSAESLTDASRNQSWTDQC